MLTLPLFSTCRKTISVLPGCQRISSSQILFSPCTVSPSILFETSTYSEPSCFNSVTFTVSSEPGVSEAASTATSPKSIDIHRSREIILENNVFVLDLSLIIFASNLQNSCFCCLFCCCNFVEFNIINTKLYCCISSKSNYYMAAAFRYSNCTGFSYPLCI